LFIGVIGSDSSLTPGMAGHTVQMPLPGREGGPSGTIRRRKPIGG
jgi:hypothetical protein